jgi:hypothetical protein
MNRKPLILAALCTVFSSFSFAAASDDYRISEVPCTIDNFIQDDKLHVHISLPDGLELPEKLIFSQQAQGIGCVVNTKVIDKERFPDSEGYPLTSFIVEVSAYHNPEDHALTLTVQKVTEVVQQGWFTNQTRFSSNTTQTQFHQMSVNQEGKPQFTVLEGEPQKGVITINIIFEGQPPLESPEQQAVDLPEEPSSNPASDAPIGEAQPASEGMDQTS